MAAAIPGVALGLFAALAMSGVAGCGSDCGRVRQQLYVSMPDSALQPLLDACRTHQAAPGETCNPNIAYPDIECGCLPACRRLLEIADQFPGPEDIDECHYLTVSTPMVKASSGVAVGYRPASCP